MDKLPLRPNVCMLVFNRHGKLFLGERYKEPGIWQFPQGGAERNLSLEENVTRELCEELGGEATIFSIVCRLKATHEYEFSDPPSYASGKWRGQSQTFWAVRFTGTDSDIVLDRHTPEFMSWRWCTPDEVRQIAEPRRVPGYLKPLAEFENLLAHGLLAST